MSTTNRIGSPIVIATQNEGKLLEYRQMFMQQEIPVLSPKDAGLEPGLRLEENANTFEGNARMKADALQKLTGNWSLGDDSGLEVDALDGRPGVLSARYAGIDTQGKERDRANNEKLLKELEDVGENLRTARFRCAIVLAGPKNYTIRAEGICEGRIAFSPSGTGGFGYDPVFLPDGYRCSMAELSLDEKNKISHRGRALVSLMEYVTKHQSTSDYRK